MTPSFVNTLLKWYSTVLGLMNSSLPISGLVRPAAASRAICDSCGVRSAWRPRCACGGLSGRHQLTPGALGERFGAHPVEHVVGETKLLTGVEPAVLAPQPLAVQQVGAGEIHDDPGPPQPLDRLDVERVGGSPEASSARERARIPSAQSVPAAASVPRVRRSASAATSGILRAAATRRARRGRSHGRRGHRARTRFGRPPAPRRSGRARCRGSPTCSPAYRSPVPRLASSRCPPPRRSAPIAFASSPRHATSTAEAYPNGA